VRARKFFGFVLLILAAMANLAVVADEPVRVFAAASLKNSLDEAGAAWKAETGKAVVASYAASSALAKQIEQGAPADIFISADLDWMDYLDGKGLIRPRTRVNLLGNTLVLIAPAGSRTKVDLNPGANLAGTLAGGKLAIGEVNSVPAGKYGKAALEKLGLWSSVEGNVAMTENVRAALALVARGEARLGIVYATDAKAEPQVEIAGTFPADSHPPIISPAALSGTASNPDARAFLSFLSSSRAGEIFRSQGFDVLR
jgi:molybdate transport system substrate-binding protein